MYLPGVKGGGMGIAGFSVLILVLASTRPMVSGVSVSVHARPRAWECGAYRWCLSGSSLSIVFLSARATCGVPGPVVLRTARIGVLAWSCACSRI